MPYMMLKPEQRSMTEQEVRDLAARLQTEGKIPAEFVVGEMRIDRLILLLEGLDDEYEFAD